MQPTGAPTGVIAPAGGFKDGGFYGGAMYHASTNSFEAPGMANGVKVSSAVNQQSDAAQGLKAGTIDTYVGNGGGNPAQPNGVQTSPNQNGGVSGMGTGAPAVPNLQAIYDSAYTNNPDVKTAQASITSLQSQLTAKQQARDTAIANENDNPFYSEATRVGRVQKLNDNYNNDANTITNQLNTATTNLTNLQAEAQRQTNLAQGQYTLTNGAYKQNLDEFNTLLAAGGLENADPATLASISVSTGISTGMLQSIQQSQQAKNTQIITSTDNNGNLTIAAVNSQTGKVINTQTMGGVGKTTGGTKANTADGLSAMTPKILGQLNSYGNISPAAWNQAQAAWIAAGLPKADFVANFSQYADTNRGDFLQAYGFANPKTAETIKQNTATKGAPNFKLYPHDGYTN